MWGAGSGVREWQRPITRENWLVFLISLVRTKEGLVAFLSPIALAAYLKRKLSPGEAWSTLGVLVLAGMEGTWQCQGLAGARFPENLFHCGDLPAPQGILFSGSPSILLISSPLAVSPPSPSRPHKRKCRSRCLQDFPGHPRCASSRGDGQYKSAPDLL